MQWWINVCFISNNSQFVNDENKNKTTTSNVTIENSESKPPGLEWNDAAGHIMYKHSVYLNVRSNAFFDFHIFLFFVVNILMVCRCAKKKRKWIFKEWWLLAVYKHTYTQRDWERTRKEPKERDIETGRDEERIEHFLRLQMNGWHIIHTKAQRTEHTDTAWGVSSINAHQSKNGSLVVISNTWYKSLFNAIITTTIESNVRPNSHTHTSQRRRKKAVWDWLEIFLERNVCVLWAHMRKRVYGLVCVRACVWIPVNN